MQIPCRFALPVLIAIGCVFGDASTSRAQVFELITSFTGCAPEGCPPDGDLGLPSGPLLAGRDGFFYGALVPDWRTPADMPRSRGAIYRIDTAGQRTILHRFNDEGASICGGGSLTIADDGALYGIGYSCELAGGSSIFRLAGTTFEVLQAFAPGGFTPESLFAGPGGAFYGLGRDPAVDTGPIVYEWNGAVRVLQRHIGSDHWRPRFVRAPDGNLYYPLLINYGFIGFVGSILRIGPGGVIERLQDVVVPITDLVVGSDGNLYGNSGATLSASRSVYRLTLAGEVTYVASESLSVLAAEADGSVLVHERFSIHGDIHRLTRDGASVPVHSFAGSDGSGELAQLTQGPDGHLYGVRSEGGAHDLGVFYRIRMPSGDIKANGGNGPIAVGPGDPLEISLAFDAAPGTTVDPAEVYVAVVTPSLDVFWMTGTGFTATPTRLYAGPLAAFDPIPLITIPDVSALPEGDYYWVTIVDRDANGVPNGPFVDYVKTTRVGAAAVPAPVAPRAPP